MKRRVHVPAMFLFGVLSLFGCAMTSEEDVDPIAEVSTIADDEELEAAAEPATLNCKAQCVQLLKACLRMAENDEDRAECSANHAACIADCEVCDDPAPCPWAAVDR